MIYILTAGHIPATTEHPIAHIVSMKQIMVVKKLLFFNFNKM